MGKEMDMMHAGDGLVANLLKALPVGVDLVDMSGTILFANRFITERFGGEVVGKKCWDVYRDDHQQCVNCPLRNGVHACGLLPKNWST